MAGAPDHFCRCGLSRKLHPLPDCAEFKREWTPRRIRAKPVATISVNVGELPTLDAYDRAMLDADRPKTRGDCVDGPRPCPWVGCKHHNYLEVSPRNGTIRVNVPALEDMADSCSLDVADEGPQILSRIGDIFRVTRERIRQQESELLGKLKGVPVLGELATGDNGPDTYNAGLAGSAGDGSIWRTAMKGRS